MKHLVALGALGLSTAAVAAPEVVYSNDFGGSATTAYGVTGSGPTGGAVANATAPSGYGAYYGNASGTATVLTLSDLPQHTGIDIDFDLLFVDSWDGINGVVAPDYLDVLIDGTVVATYSVDNFYNNYASIGGGTQTIYGAFAGTAGYGDRGVSYAGDSLYAFAHSASSITLGFQFRGRGFQGGPDESFGIDNVVVRLDGIVPPTQPGAVPEPATWAMMIAGFGLVGAASRRRRTMAVVA